MLLDVLSVTPREDFQLDLVFANGERRCFDMRPLLSMKPWTRVATSTVFHTCTGGLWNRGLAR